MEIRITEHAVDRWMARSGTKNRDRARRMLRSMLERSEEVDLKPNYRATQLLNHAFKAARYFLHRSPYKGRKWILVVVDNELKTVHNGSSKSGAARWETRRT